jgi:hypothetical protein
MTSNAPAIIIGSLAARKSAVQQGELLRAITAGKTVAIVDPSPHRAGSRSNETGTEAVSDIHRPRVVIDDAWFILPRPDHLAGLPSRRGRVTRIWQTVTDFGGEPHERRFLRSPGSGDRQLTAGNLPAGSDDPA